MEQACQGMELFSAQDPPPLRMPSLDSSSKLAFKGPRSRPNRDELLYTAVNAVVEGDCRPSKSKAAATSSGDPASKDCRYLALWRGASDCKKGIEGALAWDVEVETKRKDLVGYALTPLRLEGIFVDVVDRLIMYRLRAWGQGTGGHKPAHGSVSSVICVCLGDERTFRLREPRV